MSIDEYLGQFSQEGLLRITEKAFNNLTSEQQLEFITKLLDNDNILDDEIYQRYEGHQK